MNCEPMSPTLTGGFVMVLSRRSLTVRPSTVSRNSYVSSGIRENSVQPCHRRRNSHEFRYHTNRGLYHVVISLREMSAPALLAWFANKLRNDLSQGAAYPVPVNQSFRQSRGRTSVARLRSRQRNACNSSRGA